MKVERTLRENLWNHNLKKGPSCLFTCLMLRISVSFREAFSACNGMAERYSFYSFLHSVHFEQPFSTTTLVAQTCSLSRILLELRKSCPWYIELEVDVNMVLLSEQLSLRHQMFCCLVCAWFEPSTFIYSLCSCLKQNIL